MLRLHDLLLDRQVEIIDLLVWETGKARKDAFLEIAHLAMTARYYGRTAARHLASRRVAGAYPVVTRPVVNRIPKGVVGIISPWNYPLDLSMCDGLAAIAAGNAVVLKPDERTMLTALLGAQLLAEAGLPEDLWLIVSGDGPTIGSALIERADYVCFTGSTRAGRQVATQCAERLIGCSLELGGKNPLLVLADADIDKVAEGAVRAVYSNAGQLCVSIERIYVADQIADEFMDAFVARTQALSLGAGLDWEIDMGSLFSQAQVTTVNEHLSDALSKGAEVVSGGKHRPDLGAFVFEPTILEGVNEDMTCFANETFGPVVSVYRFSSEDEAVARANDGVHGLNASIYSRDTRRARAVAKRIKCGTININEPYGATFASLAAPMGGMRASGLGRRQGREGILRFTETQAVASQHVIAIGPLMGLSEQATARFMTSALKALKAIRRP